MITFNIKADSIVITKLIIEHGLHSLFEFDETIGRILGFIFFIGA